MKEMNLGTGRARRLGYYFHIQMKYIQRENRVLCYLHYYVYFSCFLLDVKGS